MSGRRPCSATVCSLGASSLGMCVEFRIRIRRIAVPRRHYCSSIDSRGEYRSRSTHRWDCISLWRRSSAIALMSANAQIPMTPVASRQENLGVPVFVATIGAVHAHSLGRWKFAKRAPRVGALAAASNEHSRSAACSLHVTVSNRVALRDMMRSGDDQSMPAESVILKKRVREVCA